MQTSFQKEESVKLGSVRFDADFGAGYVNLGGLKSATLNLSINVLELTVDNAKMKPRTKILKLTLSANLYEFDLENLRKITGLGTLATVDGTQTVATQEIDAVSANQAFALDHQNADGSKITSLVSITASGGTFTNYSMTTLEDGRSAILFTANATNIVATYNYTPAESKQWIFQDVIQSQQLSKFRFVNTNDEGKRFIIEFPQGYSSGDSMELSFQADETTDEAANFPITITAFPDGDKNLCRIIDEQNVL